MGKLWIIIGREYLSRVKNKTFIVMCFVLPGLIGGALFTSQELSSRPGEVRKVVVVDESLIPDSLKFAFVLKDTANLRFNFDYVFKPQEEARRVYKDSSNVSILYIPENFFNEGDSANPHSPGFSVVLKSRVEPGANTINLIQSILSKAVQKEIMKSERIPQHAIDLSQKKVDVSNEVNGTISNGAVKGTIGILFGFVIYMYIIMFGVQIMRSVVEEKMTRIVEIIVSSVRPFQLLLGKIIGVTLVGLTQFSIWIILSIFVVTPVINSVNAKKTDITKNLPVQMKTGVSVAQDHSALDMNPTAETQKLVEDILSVPWGNLIPAFLLYFLFGYFMYASIFAALGSAADMDADTQQFSLPVTIPLMIAMFSSVTILNDPNGTVAQWLSMIPFTSPIVMLMRIPYGGVTIVEFCTSIGILIASFLFMTWIAGRIYRVGILMYGKKVSWKELGKWIFYKA